MVLLDENKRIIEKPWYFIKETQGVIGFVGGEPPTPTPTDEVESIKQQISASEEHEKPKVSFEVGETVKINNGPFLNFSGVIEEIEPERGKLKVTVNIFGRNTPVELEYWQVEKAETSPPPAQQKHDYLWQRKLLESSNCRSRPARPTRPRPSAPRSVSTA